LPHRRALVGEVKDPESDVSKAIRRARRLRADAGVGDVAGHQYLPRRITEVRGCRQRGAESRELMNPRTPSSSSTTLAAVRKAWSSLWRWPRSFGAPPSAPS